MLHERKLYLNYIHSAKILINFKKWESHTKESEEVKTFSDDH